MNLYLLKRSLRIVSSVFILNRLIKRFIYLGLAKVRINTLILIFSLFENYLRVTPLKYKNKNFRTSFSPYYLIISLTRSLKSKTFLYIIYLFKVNRLSFLSLLKSKNLIFSSFNLF
jgi:hypothetical protein